MIARRDSDAQREADRLVGDYARLVRSVEREPGIDGMMRERGEALAAVLAAAIEVHDKARHRQSDTRGQHVLRMPVGQWHDLGEALSELRSTGEDT